VTKGVRELPGSYFGLFLSTGIFFVFIAFALFLPIMVLMPQKFAISFTLGCTLIMASLFALKGPANQLAHMTSKGLGSGAGVLARLRCREECRRGVLTGTADGPRTEDRKETREKKKGGGTHSLEGDLEGLQEWRVRGGIWRGHAKWRSI
jgi:hypothetical protein